MQIDVNQSVNDRIEQAFRTAGEATGTSFSFLLDAAHRESSLDPSKASNTSSARGLFQFTEQTWLEVVKTTGASVGLDQQANAITQDSSGTYTVADPAAKAKILALRHDPLVSSVMAGKLTQLNAERLGTALGRAPTEGELHIAHVLGASGAVKLVRLAASDPNSTAAQAFPKAAEANKALFYDAAGKPKTVKELAARLATTRVDAADTGSGRILSGHTVFGEGSAGHAKAVADAVRAAADRASAEGSRTDPARLGRQVASAGTSTVATTTATDADPGVSPAGRLDGWRAHTPTDAFSALMRNDEASDHAPKPKPTGILGYGELAQPTEQPPIRLSPAEVPVATTASVSTGATGGAATANATSTGLSPDEPIRLIPGDTGPAHAPLLPPVNTPAPAPVRTASLAAGGLVAGAAIAGADTVVPPASAPSTTDAAATAQTAPIARPSRVLSSAYGSHSAPSQPAASHAATGAAPSATGSRPSRYASLDPSVIGGRNGRTGMPSLDAASPRTARALEQARTTATGTAASTQRMMAPGMPALPPLPGELPPGLSAPFASATGLPLAPEIGARAAAPAGPAATTSRGTTSAANHTAPTRSTTPAPAAVSNAATPSSPAATSPTAAPAAAPETAAAKPLNGARAAPVGRPLDLTRFMRKSSDV